MRKKSLYILMLAILASPLYSYAQVGVGVHYDNALRDDLMITLNYRGNNNTHEGSVAFATKYQVALEEGASNFGDLKVSAQFSGKDPRPGNTSFLFGIKGSYIVLYNLDDRNDVLLGNQLGHSPYFGSVYSGLSYEPNRKIAMQAKIDIVSYADNGGDKNIAGSTNTWSLFGSGSVGLSYFV